MEFSTRSRKAAELQDWLLDLLRSIHTHEQPRVIVHDLLIVGKMCLDRDYGLTVVEIEAVFDEVYGTQTEGTNL